MIGVPSLVPSLGEEYSVFRTMFFRNCFLHCIREFLSVDGAEYYVVIDGESPIPYHTPTYVSTWADIDENSTDKIYVKIYKNKMTDSQELIGDFTYKIADFIGDYRSDSETDSILSVFKLMSDAFQKDYIHWWLARSENNND